MNARTVLAWLGPCALLAQGCGHAAKVRPVERGAVVLEETWGGPLASVGGVPAPTPLSTAGLSYGVAQRVDVSAHVHPTAAAFRVFGLDVGASWLAIDERGWIPALSLSGRLYGFSDLRTGARAYLEPGLAVSHRVGSRGLIYVSGGALVQMLGPVLGSVAVGGELYLGRLAFQVEGRWYEPDYRTDRGVVKWVGIDRRGAVGIIVGWRVTLGPPGGER